MLHFGFVNCVNQKNPHNRSSQRLITHNQKSNPTHAVTLKPKLFCHLISTPPTIHRVLPFNLLYSRTCSISAKEGIPQLCNTRAISQEDILTEPMTSLDNCLLDCFLKECILPIYTQSQRRLSAKSRCPPD